MFEHRHIPIESVHQGAPAELDRFEAPAAACQPDRATISWAKFAANEASAAEAALILTAPRAASSSHPTGHAARPPLAVSRVLDVIIAGTLCVVLLPVLAFIAIYLKVLERGPVLFAHGRIGLGGKPFACLKFRTMCVNADQVLARLLATDDRIRQEWNSAQKLVHDPRVTRFGRILRHTSLDELPQLINVLRGEMSIVGPRPVIEDELHRYGRHAALYTSVRPGLTGLWQVTRNAQTSYRRRVATDVFYVRHQTIAIYFRILFATVPAVLMGNG